MATSAGLIVLEKIVEQDLNLGTAQVDVTHPASGKQRGDQINIATFSNYAELVWAPGAVGPGSYITQIVPCVGAYPGDPVMVSFDGTLGHEHFTLAGRVVNRNEVLVTMINGDLINPLAVGSGALRVFDFNVPL